MHADDSVEICDIVTRSFNYVTLASDDQYGKLSPKILEAISTAVIKQMKYEKMRDMLRSGPVVEQLWSECTSFWHWAETMIIESTKVKGGALADREWS